MRVVSWNVNGIHACVRDRSRYLARCAVVRAGMRAFRELWLTDTLTESPLGPQGGPPRWSLANGATATDVASSSASAAPALRYGPSDDGGAVRRSGPGDVGRNGPGRGRLDYPRRAHEGEAGSPRPALGSGARDPARGTVTERWHGPGIPQPAREATLLHDAVEIDQGTRHRRRAAWVPVELPGLGRGTDEPTPRGGRGRARPYGTEPHRGGLRTQSDLFERRRRLMDDWEAYLSGTHGRVWHDDGNRASRPEMLPTLQPTSR